MNLTSKDHADLKRLEKEIAEGLPTFLRIGRALSEINERKLYRISHETWESYCEERWQISRNYSYRLMNAAEKVDAISVKMLPRGNKTDDSPVRQSSMPKTEMDARRMPAPPPAPPDAKRFADLTHEEQLEEFLRDEEELDSEDDQHQTRNLEQRRYDSARKHYLTMMKKLEGIEGMQEPLKIFASGWSAVDRIARSAGLN